MTPLRRFVLLFAIPSAALDVGCGCSYGIQADVHATVLDAVTGQPIAAPQFTNLGGVLAPTCESGGDAGVCATWLVLSLEGGPVTVSAPGYASQTIALPSHPQGTCVNSDDSVTKTVQLVKAP